MLFFYSRSLFTLSLTFMYKRRFIELKKKLIVKEEFEVLIHDCFLDMPLHLHINERKEFIQETQHTQQTAIRIAQHQDKKTT